MIRRALFLLLFSAATSFGAFSEFYVTGTGSNLNAGSTTSNTAFATYVSDAVLGWNSSTGVFGTLGDPVADGVTVGMFASVYVTVGATNATFVARITARTTSSVTVSLTAVSGTPPTTDLLLGGITMKVGGAWVGPSGASGFPFNFAATAMVNVAGDRLRVNFKAGTYAITAAMTHSLDGIARFQGYTTTPGDFGKAIIDGGTSGAAYVLLTLSGANNDFADFIFQNNGASSTGSGMAVSGIENTIARCVFNNVRAAGLSLGSTATNCLVSESEAYACNQSNTASIGGFTTSTGGGHQFIRTFSYDNAGSNSSGFVFGSGAVVINSIAESNGAAGLTTSSASYLAVRNSDFYNNIGDGINLTASGANVAVLIENSNFVKNGGYGINSSASPTLRNGSISNCGFGSGTQANTSGAVLATLTLSELGRITYPADVTPYADAPNGDFDIVLAEAKGTGRGAFTQTAAGYAGTLGFPDVGASQGTSLVPRHIPSIGD